MSMFKKKISHSKINTRATTLIELMLVVFIIGVLAVAVVPNYVKSVERAKCSQAMQQLKLMHNAAIVYYRVNQSFVGMTKTNTLPLPNTHIGKLVGERFADNPDWTYTVTVVNAASFTVNARRENGNWAGDTLTLDQDNAWGGAYPYTDPGGW